MSTRDTLDDQRRRDRINRMKKAIVGILVFWMIFSLAAIVILSVFAVSLSGRLRRIERSLLDGTAKVQEQMEEKGHDGGETSEQLARGGDSTQSAEEEQTQDASAVVYGIDDEENLAKEGDTHRVFLTFDGGPDDNTDAILDVLRSYNVKATFFVNGDDSARMKSVYRRIVADGHTLGMRSYSSRYSEIYDSAESFSEDLQKISDFLFRVTGLRSKYYRFPGGSGNEISNVEMSKLAGILREQNLTWFDWNVTADDLAVDSTTEDVVASVVSGVEKYKTSIVLLHEGTDRDTTVAALGPLIEALQKMQAQILPIDDETYVVQYIKAESID